MSGVFKGIKKAFKKIGTFVKRHWKAILIAAAVVFTAGVALAYFAPAAMAASGVAGFGSAGVFTSTAAALGSTGAAAVMAGGAATAAGGAASGAAGLGILSETGYGASAAYAASVGAAGGVAGTGLAAGAGVGGAAAATAAVTAGAGATAGGGAAAAAGLSLTEKVMIGQMAVSTVSGLLAKKPDPYPIQKQYGGYDKKGNGPGMRYTYDPLTGSLVPGSVSTPKSVDAPKLSSSIPTRGLIDQPEETDSGVDRSQVANAEAQQGESDGLIADTSAKDLQGGPSLKDRQQSIRKGYESGDYSGVV